MEGEKLVSLLLNCYLKSNWISCGISVWLLLSSQLWNSLGYCCKSPQNELRLRERYHFLSHWSWMPLSTWSTWTSQAQFEASSTFCCFFFLTWRDYVMSLSESVSSKIEAICNVPHGSILYKFCTLHILPSIIRVHGIDFHSYTDDTHVYLPHIWKTRTFHKLSSCINSINMWISQNFMHLNRNKTEVHQWKRTRNFTVYVQKVAINTKHEAKKA